MDKSLRDLIDGLPQRRFIPDDRVAKWVGAVMKDDPARLEWHIRRLYGWGGSESGAAVAYARGEYSLTNAAEVAASKLMLRSPESSPDTQRGITLEPHINTAFLIKTNATVDEESEAKLREIFTRGDSRRPWRRPNVDRIALIRRKGALRRYIVDYKCPRTENAQTYLEAGIPLEYDSQLHYYAGAAIDAGIEIDGILLAPFDCDRWDVYPIEGELKTAMLQEVEKTVDYLWNTFVLAGKIPDLNAGDSEAKFIPDPQMRALAAEYAAIHAVVGPLTDRKKEIADVLRRIAEHLGMTGVGNCMAGPVKVQALKKAQYDLYVLQGLAESAGVNLEHYVTDRKVTYDLEKLCNDLKVKNPSIDLSRAVREEQAYKVETTRKRSGPEAEMMASIKELGQATAKTSVKSVIDYAAGLVNGSPIASIASLPSPALAGAAVAEAANEAPVIPQQVAVMAGEEACSTFPEM